MTSNVHLTGREARYIGGKCHHRDETCWNPATHRVQNGSGGGAGGCWWFVCWAHIEAAARDPADGRKARVRKLAISPGQAAAAQLIIRMGAFSRAVRRWAERRCPRCGETLTEKPEPLKGRVESGHLHCGRCHRRYTIPGGRGELDMQRWIAERRERTPR